MCVGVELTPWLGIINYPNDTLVLTRGGNFEDTAHLATVGVALMVRRIEALGLRVVLNKS